MSDKPTWPEACMVIAGIAGGCFVLWLIGYWLMLFLAAAVLGPIALILVVLVLMWFWIMLASLGEWLVWAFTGRKRS